ncbi:gluconate 2-dehydrogenase subunit 3 family protein [Aquimarina sediminis]|uniref:gluconate 2-dehydrogenase subunit 3 family protein n=1 Tax=Aquimarina sediminis TaxID=2070536 RepID=UPI000CA025D6|nr:gluconate 2-dehydrogenase subunit 3 family protein [Aquimarina sediminis]
MERRQAIKNIALGLGLTISTPTILNILSSCNSENKSSKTLFLTSQQEYVITHLSDIIIPVLDEQDRNELDLVQFIDKMIYHTVEKKKKELFNLGGQQFEKAFQSRFDQNSMNGSRKEYQELLDSYFSISQEDQKLLFEQLDLDIADIPENKKTSLLTYHFLTTIRQYSLLGYYTSKIYYEKQ